MCVHHRPKRKMPRAFLVLNKKTKSKQRKCAADDDHGLLTDENQNVQEDINNDRSSEDFLEVVKTDEETENEEDIEIDVEGPCPVHEELILPHHHSERDSVTSLSPGSSNSLQNLETSEQNTSYTSHESRGSSPSPSRAFHSLDGRFRTMEQGFEYKGKFCWICYDELMKTN